MNKVETMVEGSFQVSQSDLLSEEQKQQVAHKLANKINSEGFLQVRSQVHRTQRENKDEVIRKINALIAQALKKEKKRIATKPSKTSQIKRVEKKRKQSVHKENRKKIRYPDL